MERKKNKYIIILPAVLFLLICAAILIFYNPVPDTQAPSPPALLSATPDLKTSQQAVSPSVSLSTPSPAAPSPDDAGTGDDESGGHEDPSDENDGIAVHVTKSGAKYHKAGCSSLSKSDITITLSEALAKGYSPCSVCMSGKTQPSPTRSPAASKTPPLSPSPSPAPPRSPSPSSSSAPEATLAPSPSPSAQLPETPPQPTAPAEKDDENEDATVYITASGSKYHLDGCRHLSKSKIESTLKEAKEKGLEPCSVCKPPE